MAYYAAIVSVVQLLKDITLYDQYPNFLPDKHQLHVSLYEKFNLLLEMVDDYSPKDQEEETNDILQGQIRDVAYRAQDMIESHISTILLARIQLENRPRGVERLRRLWHSTSGNVPDNIGENEYDQGLEKVKTEVDFVLEELTRIKVESFKVHEDLLPNSEVSVEASRVQAPSGESTMLVFDEDFMTKIKAQLCGESSKLEVISIAGMGGLGKTTLARNIFHDRLIHDHFECYAWITVSQDYCLKNIVLAMVNSLNINEEKSELGEKELKELDGDDIYKYLFGRKYLIVIDDVWNARFWDGIKRILPDNLNGSRILMTTRLSDLAAYVSNSSFLHQMQFLNENQSWILLREKVFAAQEQFPKELEVIGKLIAKNCRGLPLAIVVIAGVLSNVERAQHDWEKIARKVSSNVIDQNDDYLSTILSLSYNHLPHDLKPCFLYLGGYPEDHEIPISMLIRLWVAEGFLKPNESKSLEEVGEEYFNDLVNRNLVLITGKKSNGKFKFCIVHDVLRELCHQRARDENFLLCVQGFHRAPIMDVRRVCIQSVEENSKILKYIKEHGSHIRSLINHFPKYCYEDDLLSAAYGCKLLRILDTRAWLRKSNFNILWQLLGGSGEITKLLHLRYLKLLSFSPVASGILHLQNLQTLVLGSRERLPSEIWKMSRLRHVMCKMGVELPSIPYEEIRIIDGVPLLGSLQTLSSVGQFRCTIDTLEMIPNLKKLGFQCSCQADQKWEKYMLSNLIHLHQLETLYILLSYESDHGAIPLPENFAFPSTLKTLTLKGCRLPWKDMSVVGSLPNLQVLKLRSNAFVGEEWEPIEGEFLKLKFLEIKGLLSLERWQAEDTHFPCLEQLHIRSCNRLKKIPPGIGDIPTLKLIKVTRGVLGRLVWGSRSVLGSSALEIQEQQRDLGNNDIQVLLEGFRQRSGAGVRRRSQTSARTW